MYCSTAAFSVSRSPFSSTKTGTAPFGDTAQKSLSSSSTFLVQRCTKWYRASMPASISAMRLASEQAIGKKYSCSILRLHRSRGSGRANKRGAVARADRKTGGQLGERDGRDRVGGNRAAA